jgi:hypothetical protein
VSPTLTLILALVAVEIMVVGLVVPALVSSSGLRDLIFKHPAVPPLPGAVRREFQSFSFGLVNLGFCIHAAVDEQRLHLEPAWLARRVGISRGASIPLELVRVKPGSRPGSRYVKATIDGVECAGPRWCLDLESHRA